MADSKGIKYIIEVASKKAVADLELVNKKLSEMEDNAKSLEKMRQGALVMGAALAAGLGVAINQAIKVESAMAPVRSVLSGTAAEVQASTERIKKASMAWSSTHVQSSEEFLQASYNMLSAGLNETQAIAGSQQALALATATMGDAVEASQLLGTVYNNFGDITNDATKEMTYLSDTITKTQQLFQIANLAQYNEGLKNVAGAAVASKIPFDQVSTVIGQLNTNAKTGANAGSALKTILLNMASASQKLGFEVVKTADGQTDLLKTIENISKVGADLNMFKDAFGAESSDAVVLLTENIEALKKAGLQVQDSFEATANAQAVFESTPAARMTIVLNKLANNGEKIGSVLIPPLLVVVNILGAVLDGITWILDTFPPLKVAFTAFIAVLAIGLTAFGSWVFWTKAAVMWQSLWNSALIVFNAVNPFMLAVVGVIALVAGIISLVKYWDTVIAKLKEFRDMIAVGLVKAWDFVVAKIARFFTAEYWIGLGQGIMDGLKFAWDWYVNYIKTIFSGDFWAGVWQSMLDSFTGALKKMWDGIVGWWDNIKKLARGEAIDSPVAEIVKDQEKLANSVPASKSVSAVKKVQAVPSSGSLGGEVDWGMNQEFLAANGFGAGGAVKASPAVVNQASAGVKQMSNKSQSVDNSRSIHIANVTIDGANITDFESFRMELASAVGA